MAFHYVYLFQADGFLQDIQPLVEPIASGDLAKLRERAKQELDSPIALAFMDNLRYGGDDIIRDETDWEGGLEASVLVTVLLAKYATPLPLGSDFRNGWRSFRLAWTLLELTGWEKSDTWRLFKGRTLCELLEPLRGESRAREQRAIGRRLWCDTLPGWLGIHDIRLFKDRLQLVQPNIEIAKATMRMGRNSDWTVQTTLHRMTQAMDHLKTLLDTALARNLPLLTTVEE